MHSLQSAAVDGVGEISRWNFLHSAGLFFVNREGAGIAFVRRGFERSSEGTGTQSAIVNGLEVTKRGGGIVFGFVLSDDGEEAGCKLYGEARTTNAVVSALIGGRHGYAVSIPAPSHAKKGQENLVPVVLAATRKICFGTVRSAALEALRVSRGARMARKPSPEKSAVS